jgi:myo-inositol-1(or 4)-monophosphatase
VTPAALLELFDAAAAAVRDALADIAQPVRRARTERPGQYALDVLADDAACEVLSRAAVRIVSEETGIHGDPDAAITVVIDPVDGSTNCARGIAYWATSIAAVDADGLACSLVINQATGARTTAVRGGGAYRDGVRLHASKVTRIEDAVISIAALPSSPIPWKQYRAFACSALALCEVAAGGLDAHVDTNFAMRPWDYLGALLACEEAGAIVFDARDERLVTTDPTARRRVVAAGTSELAATLKRAVR